ncbi:MAG: HIT family protein [Gemmatimonadota bacterium]|nr:HIT family protein [Gemmatimonadota bacterium]
MTTIGEPDCVFCAILARRQQLSLVTEDPLTVALLDLRQFHPGHVLVIPRRHVVDIRALDDETGAALMGMLARVARAVDAAFPSDGLSVWHSAGAGANQEVPHLHFHVHPRRIGDDVLRVYPSSPPTPNRATLDRWASKIRDKL